VVAKPPKILIRQSEFCAGHRSPTVAACERRRAGRIAKSPDKSASRHITEARQHHRARRDSQSGVKGVRHNPETDTWSAYAYRAGQCHHLGTFASKEQAQYAYEAQMRKENPDLHDAPPRVEHTGIGQPDRGSNPDMSRERDTRIAGGRVSTLAARA
jgi:hypothetical protein